MSFIETKNILHFKTDKVFEDFAVAPIAKYVPGSPEKWKGEYSEEYQESIKQGKVFVIEGRFKSFVNRTKKVTKRVLLPKEMNTPRKDAQVTLPVKNIGNLFGKTSYKIWLKGTCLNPENNVKSDDAARLILDKWQETAPNDEDLKDWLEKQEAWGDESLSNLVKTINSKEHFNGKFEVKSYGYFIEYSK